MSVERWSLWQANLVPSSVPSKAKRALCSCSETVLNDVLPVVNVLPLTSCKPGRRIYPNEALLPGGTADLTADSLVLCYQIRTLDKHCVFNSASCDKAF